MNRLDPAEAGERIRAVRAIFDEAARIRSMSPFPTGSGEPVAIMIEHIAHGCELAAKAIMRGQTPPNP